MVFWGGGYGLEKETLVGAQGWRGMGLYIEGPRSCNSEVRLV